MAQCWKFGLLLTGALLGATRSNAAILWGDLGSSLVHETGPGTDILGGAVKRDDSAADTLYFKFHVDPLSDVSTEEYFAAFQLFEGETERLGVGNSQKAWGYSAFNTVGMGKYNQVFGDQDLRSARPESVKPGEFLPYELPRRGIENTVVFKVHYIPGAEDEVTVWLNPELGPGATEARQPESCTTRFSANASFNQVRLRHGGGGPGWIFSGMAIATSFADFVSGTSGVSGGGGVAAVGVAPLTFRSWVREQGLPQNSVRALAQTPDGYLWLGGEDGVARFDGVRFAWYGSREGLAGKLVRVLFVDTSGVLWIGTDDGGLTQFQNGRFYPLNSREGLGVNSVLALAEDGTGRVWAGTDSGLAIWKHRDSVAVPAASKFKNHPIPALFKDASGTIWLGATGLGIFLFKNGQFVPVTDPSVEALLKDPHSLLIDRAGRLWVGAGDDFVLCREGQEWRRYRIPRHLGKPFISSLAEGQDGSVWAGSISEGLFQFHEGKLDTFNAGTGLPDNFIESLLVDVEGNLWIGSGAGLTRVRRSKLSVLGQSEGLGYGTAQGLAEVRPGIVWVAKAGEGLYRWDANSLNRLVPSEGAALFSGVNTLLAAPDGSCWAGSTNGLWQFMDPASKMPRPDPVGVRDRNVLALAHARGGGVWAGTQSGELWRSRGGVWRIQTNTFAARPIIALAETDSALWVGTDGAGLYRIGGRGEHFDKKNGLLTDTIRALLADPDGTVWIGTGGGGLLRWSQDRLSTITTRDGLPDNDISQLLEDKHHRLWMGTRRGIACIRKRDLLELGVGQTTTVYPVVYSRPEGMPSDECTGGFCPAGLKTESGLLWFPTAKGIVVIDPDSSATRNGRPPTVLVEDIQVDGLSVGGASNPIHTPRSHSRASAGSNPIPAIRVPPGKHRLEFRYTGLSFEAPEKIRFRYKLDPLDAGWVEAGSQRVASYGYVPPGQYQFRLTACNDEGNWNQADVSIALTFLPHPWQSGWFVTLFALGMLALVGLGVWAVEKRRAYRQLKTIEQERAIDRERARIAQDLHDDLGSSLARISLLSSLARADKDNPEQVETHVNKIAQSADESVRALEEIVWAVRPGYDSLQSLVEYIAHFASELFEGNGTRCRLDLPHDLPTRTLPPDMRHNIFLIIKEALTNALKHSSASEVRVQAKADRNTIELVVQDNGRGFEPKAQAEESRRHGLGNMRERARAMGGTLCIDSAAGKGTAVRLTVNVPETSTGTSNHSVSHEAN